MLKKQDIVRDLSKRFGVPLKDMKEYVDATFGIMQDELLRGWDVTIYGFFIMTTKMCMWRNLHKLVSERRFAAEPYRKIVCRFATWLRNQIKHK